MDEPINRLLGTLELGNDERNRDKAVAEEPGSNDVTGEESIPNAVKRLTDVKSQAETESTASAPHLGSGRSISPFRPRVCPHVVAWIGLVPGSVAGRGGLQSRRRPKERKERGGKSTN